MGRRLHQELLGKPPQLGREQRSGGVNFTPPVPPGQDWCVDRLPRRDTCAWQG